MAYRWLGAWLFIAACSVGCGNDGPGGPPFSGSGGTGGAAGAGGTAGQTGTGGRAGMAGTGGSAVACMTSALCRSCPTDRICESATDCADGLVCIETGCDDLEGASIKQCVFAGGGACSAEMPCEGGRECLEVPGEEGKRCVKLTPGCDTSYDCAPGFACEIGNCVDRRLACDSGNGDADCPMNHVCAGTAVSSFCVRIHRDCEADFECEGVGSLCEDVDGDGKKECAQPFNGNYPSDACNNAQCRDDDPSSPVCEVSGVGSVAQCGQHGLCIDGNDCASGFQCAALWPDGRKECVPVAGATCSGFADCGVRQVCASPREGGAPSCQVGLQL